MALEQGEHGVRPYKSIGGKPGNRTLEPFTASRFQDGVLVHAARFPVKTSLGVEPRTSSFAAKTHAVWLEIIGERDGIRTRTKALSL
jgi:hypothetical protein